MNVARTLYAKFHDDQAGKLATMTARLYTGDNPPVASGTTYAGTGPVADGVIYETAAPGGYAVRATYDEAFDGIVRWVSGGTDSVTLEAPVNPDEPPDAAPATGDGDTLVDSDGSNTNVAGADALSYKTSGNVGIDGADVIAYLKTDYDAGLYNVHGRTRTDVNGRFTAPLMLDSGNQYTLYYIKQDAYGPDTKVITVG